MAGYIPAIFILLEAIRIKRISNKVYLPHLHLFINKKSLPSGLIFIGPEISKVPDLVPVPLLYQKELAIGPEGLFRSTF